MNEPLHLLRTRRRRWWSHSLRSLIAFVTLADDGCRQRKRLASRTGFGRSPICSQRSQSQSESFIIQIPRCWFCRDSVISLTFTITFALAHCRFHSFHSFHPNVVIGMDAAPMVVAMKSVRRLN